MPDNLATIRPPQPDLICELGIGGLALLMAAVWVSIMAMGDMRRLIRLSIATFLFMSFSALMAWTGQLTRFDFAPPPMAMMILGVILLSIAVGLSRLGLEACHKLSFATLIGLQAFRLPLELVMHRAATLKIMPTQLSYSGYNFDILTGLFAALICTAAVATGRVNRTWIWCWNIWGIYCLLAIVAIAIITSPMVKLFGTAPENFNTWVLYFPYVWLPCVLVTLAISGHVIVTRKLLGQFDR